MNSEQECWWEKQGKRGCASCPQMEEWLRFLKGQGLNEKCRPKMERVYGRSVVEEVSRGEASIPPNINL